MTQLTIGLADDVKIKLEARAAIAGHASLEGFVQSILNDEADAASFDGPAHLTVDTTAKLEEKLKEGINSRAIQMTAADWSQMRNGLIERHQKSPE